MVLTPVCSLPEELTVSKAKRIYLAGPFFNEKQIETIQKIEDALGLIDVDVFSPRKMALNGNPTTTKPTPETARQIFKKDYQEICLSTHVIAVIDWAMMPDTSLRVVSENSGRALSGPLQFPDSGTVWEMGCAYALRVPVYIFTANPANKLNLMLSQSAVGVIYGFGHLAHFLETGMDEAVLHSWKGEHR